MSGHPPTFTSALLSLSTAEEDRNYFNASTPAPPVQAMDGVIPPGVYRVIDGEIFRIDSGVPFECIGAFASGSR